MQPISPAVESVLGFPVTRLGATACVERIMTWVDAPGERGRHLACANPHSLVQALDDHEFAQALRTADLLTPDGVGVLLASRMRGGDLRDRVTGSDVFHGVLERMNAIGGYRVFFLGSTEATLAAIRARMAERYPRVIVAGTYSPPFREVFTAEDDAAMVNAVNAARPHVLWVAMTAPKQEKWIHRNHAALDVPFIAAVGAVFDFFTGRIKRSSPIFQRFGLEWLPRLVQEPRRLWRRNFVSNPRFMLEVLRRA